MLSSKPNSSREVTIRCQEVALEGTLMVPEQATGLVIFAHGSGSSRHSPRNQFVARSLNDRGFATLLMDLLTEEESADRRNVFDIGLLGRRVVEVTQWVVREGLGFEACGLGRQQPRSGQDSLSPWERAGVRVRPATDQESPDSRLSPEVSSPKPQASALPIGYFGASTGAGAALVAAAELGDQIKAVVSRGGRPDLAGESLPYVTAPMLLLVGSLDDVVIDLNRQAQSQMKCETKLSIVPGATHLFEEPGTLEQVAREAWEWFAKWFATG